MMAPLGLTLAPLLVMRALAWPDSTVGLTDGGGQSPIAADGRGSPLVPMLCLGGAAYAYVRWQLSRLSQQGGGYRTLLGVDSGRGAAQPLGLLLTGSARPARFAALVDGPFVGPFRHLGPRLGLTAAAAMVLPVVAAVGRVHTTEAAFTWAYRLGSGALLLALLGSLLHTTLLWNESRLLLHRLAQSPLSGSFRQLARLNVDWRPRWSMPHRKELAILMAAVDELDPSGPGYRKWLEQDAAPVRLPLLRSPAFLGAWQRLEQYLPALAKRAPDPHGRVWARKARVALALMLAFAIRDLLDRITSGFAAVSLGLALVLCAHLLYAFDGRTGVLIVDGVALALAGAVSIHAVLTMERDAILGQLWNSRRHRQRFD
jgi:hypothetical protein